MFGDRMVGVVQCEILINDNDTGPLGTVDIVVADEVPIVID